MDIIGTGLSGLVGSRITSLLSPGFSFTDMSKETNVDLMDFPTVERMIKSSPAPWVFHFAAFTDVQGAEGEKEKGKESISWKVNVDATAHIARICRESNKHLLYISTDYVFDGTQESYAEDDLPNPISWYGKTKYEGERHVSELADMGLIIRIANPYRSNPVGKMDFAHKMLLRMREGLPIQAPSDQTFCPTYIDDLAAGIAQLVNTNSTGIYHVVSRAPASPFDAATAIASEFGVKDAAITPTTYADYFAGKAKAPKQAHLKHDKIHASGISLHTFSEGIHAVHMQEQEGSNL